MDTWGYRDTGCIRSIEYMGIQGVSEVLNTWGYRDTGCIRSIGYMGIQGYRVYQEY